MAKIYGHEYGNLRSDYEDTFNFENNNPEIQQQQEELYQSMLKKQKEERFEQIKNEFLQEHPILEGMIIDDEDEHEEKYITKLNTAVACSMNYILQLSLDNWTPEDLFFRTQN